MTLTFREKQFMFDVYSQKYIRMGLTIFNFLTSSGILSYIRSRPSKETFFSKHNFTYLFM